MGCRLPSNPTPSWPGDTHPPDSAASPSFPPVWACPPRLPLGPQGGSERRLSARVAQTGHRAQEVALGKSLSLRAMSHHAGALASAGSQVAAVRDDPAARLALMARVFHGP